MSYVHMRGSSFDFSGEVTLTQNGAPVADLTGWSVAAKVKPETGNIAFALTAVWLDASQRLVRVYVDDTGAWPLGLARLMLKFTAPDTQTAEPLPVAFTVGAGFDDA